jgi:hypothetical protein
MYNCEYDVLIRLYDSFKNVHSSLLIFTLKKSLYSINALLKESTNVS